MLLTVARGDLRCRYQEGYWRDPQWPKDGQRSVIEQIHIVQGPSRETIPLLRDILAGDY